MTRLYHVLAVNDRTHTKVYMTATPIEHSPACVFLSKMTPYPKHPHLRYQLEELGSPHPYENRDVAWEIADG
jgi:hypothetical protein